MAMNRMLGREGLALPGESAGEAEDVVAKVVRRITQRRREAEIIFRAWLRRLGLGGRLRQRRRDAEEILGLGWGDLVGGLGLWRGWLTQRRRDAEIFLRMVGWVGMSFWVRCLGDYFWGGVEGRRRKVSIVAGWDLGWLVKKIVAVLAFGPVVNSRLWWV